MTTYVGANQNAATEVESQFKQFVSETLTQMEHQKSNLDKLAMSTDAAIQRQAHAISMEVAKNMEQVQAVAAQVGSRTVEGTMHLLQTDQTCANGM